MSASRRDVAAMALALATYLTVLVTSPEAVPDGVRDGVLGNVAYLVPVFVLLRRGHRYPQQRSWTLPLVGAVLAFVVAGNLVALQGGVSTDAHTPWQVDVSNMLVVPLCLVALFAALRAHLRGLRVIVALDGVTGALAGSAVATLAVMPLIRRVWNGSLVSVVSLVYPVCDVVLMAASLGAVALVGVRHGRPFLLWALGMIVFGGADIGYAYRLASDEFVVGTWLDGGWALGMVLIVVGACLTRVSGPRGVPRAGSLAVTGLSSVVAVGVLVVAPPLHQAPAPSLLALLALGCCGLRSLLAFRQLRELAAVRQLALTDELTGVANRRALYAALDERFRTGNGSPGFGLALIDLDHFKEVNDSFGHAAGDELLRVVVSRFAGALEALYTPHLLARLGGDEFAVVLHDVHSENAATACGSALQASLAEPVVLRDVALHVRASIGIALAPDHAGSRGDMLFAADSAMYAAKTSGEPTYFHSPEGAADRRKPLEVAEDLYAALERDELTVEYQPIHTGAGELVGAEALVRWDHPSRGRLGPDAFLDVAERYRLTPAIAERVLDVALADLARWRAAGSHLRTSVNVSASDLRDEGLVGIVAAALLEHGVDPDALTIEITETAMMRDPETARSVMHALAGLGVQLAVDDYGTGYSSLEYLLKLPIDEIKLDRAFSSSLADDVRAVAIVRSTVDLTHALGLRMVAEGVEDEQTLSTLVALGCDLVQGWHLGRPMAAPAFERLLGAALSR